MWAVIKPMLGSDKSLLIAEQIWGDKTQVVHTHYSIDTPNFQLPSFLMM